MPSISIINFHTKIAEYKAKVFAKKIKSDYLPFKRIVRYKPSFLLFRGFNDNGVVYQIDLEFCSFGSVLIDFWAPDETNAIYNFVKELFGKLR